MKGVRLKSLSPPLKRSLDMIIERPSGNVGLQTYFRVELWT